MRFRTIKYYFREGFVSIFRNRLMAVASILTVVACTFMVIISLCLIENINLALFQFQKTIGITSFLRSDLNAKDINDLYEKVKKIDHVSNVVFVSKEEALKSFRDGLGEDSYILDGLEEDNPMPQFFEISVDKSMYQKSVVGQLKMMQEEGIEKVQHALDITNILVSVSNVVRIAGIIVIGSLGCVSIVIIFNTIKLTVYSRKNEINIMKYVGATDWFIKWPFVIEGMIIGIVGSGLPLFIMWILYDKIISVISQKITFMSDLMIFKTSMEIFPSIVPITIGIGVFLGCVGSVTSLRKYLDV